MLGPLRAMLTTLLVAPALALAPAVMATAATDSQTSTVTPKIVQADRAWAKTQAAKQPTVAPDKKSPPYSLFYAPYECNPHATTYSDPVEDRYCFNGEWETDAGFALQWSERHTKKSERDPVPYPSLGDGGGGKLAMLPHTIYVVEYSTAKSDFIGPVKADHIWKYGITSIPHYQTRANVGRSSCNTWSKKKGYRQACSRTWIAVDQATYGWDFARFLEASMIKDYQRAHGVCPPGQLTSCR